MRIVVVICMLSVFHVALSQETQPVEKLTFKEAVKVALTKNVTINTQKNQLYASEARKLQGYGNFLPSVVASGNAGRTIGLQIDPTTGTGSNISADNVSASVQANLTIFNGFGRLNTMQQNNLLFSAQTELVARTNQDVVFTVTSQYLQVLLDQELLTIAEENAATQKVLLDQINGYVEAGVRATSDLYTQDALVKNLQLTAFRARATLENDRALLAQTIQRDPFTTFEVARPEGDINVLNWKEIPFDSLFKVALENRRDLKQQEYTVAAALRTVRVNAAAYSPSVSIYASYGSTYFASNAYKKDPTIDPPVSFKEQFTHLYPSYSYGVNLRIPIFSQFSTHTNRAVAKVTHDNAVLTRDNLYKSIQIDVQRTSKNYVNAVEAYRASQSQLQAGELALSTQKESYELGASSQVNVALANQIYVQAASSKAQAEVTLLFQRMLLEYALGTLNVDDFKDQ